MDLRILNGIALTVGIILLAGGIGVRLGIEGSIGAGLMGASLAWIGSK